MDLNINLVSILNIPICWDHLHSDLDCLHHISMCISLKYLCTQSQSIFWYVKVIRLDQKWIRMSLVFFDFEQNRLDEWLSIQIYIYQFDEDIHILISIVRNIFAICFHDLTKLKWILMSEVSIDFWQNKLTKMALSTNK